ncbi:MAG: hypothetical protein D6746_08545 [Bacteroidetes bacterium]|nr:MAG: hypothetical protein D6746_08545 [Bacteroidota bacterium]
MLDTSPEHMLQEIQAAEKDRDKHLPVYDKMVSWYHGKGFKDVSDSEHLLANHPFEYITLITPRIVQDNPKVVVNTASTVPEERIVATALKHAGQKWIEDSSFEEHLTRAVIDFSFAWCVAYVEHRKGAKDEYKLRNPKNPGWPIVERVPVRRFLMDPAALCFRDARWMGHLFVRDREDLLREAKEHPERGWNADAISNIGKDIGLDRLEERHDKDVPSRDEVVLFQFWVRDSRPDPDLGPEDGFYGAIHTICLDYPQSGDGDPKATQVREPIPFWGVPDGPYVLGGAYVGDNDDPWPLSPLAAVYSQVEEFNEQITAAAQASRRYKRLVFVDDSDIRTAEAVVGTPDGYVVPVPGLKDATGGRNIIEVEVGGVSNNQITMIQLWQSILERVSGIDSAQRGEVEGRGTATEVAVADKVTDLRVGKLKIEFQRYVLGILQRVLWYIYHDEDIEVSLGQAGAEELNMQNPIFKGGDPDPKSPLSFWNLRFKIETMSMERTTEALNQRRVLQATQLIANMAPVIRQFPEVDWKSVLNRVGDALNIPNMDEVIDLKMAAQFLGLQYEMQSQGGSFGSSSSNVSYANTAADRGVPDAATQPFRHVTAENAAMLGEAVKL